jgi:hypothetical protein
MIVADGVGYGDILPFTVHQSSKEGDTAETFFKKATPTLKQLAADGIVLEAIYMYDGVASSTSAHEGNPLQQVSQSVREKRDGV